MPMTGFSRLEDLIGIACHDIDEYKTTETVKEILDEMQAIINKLPDDSDSKYIISMMFDGIKHNQAIAQLEVMRDESNFMATLEFALSNEKIREKIREMIS